MHGYIVFDHLSRGSQLDPTLHAPRDGPYFVRFVGARAIRLLIGACNRVQSDSRLQARAGVRRRQIRRVRRAPERIVLRAASDISVDPVRPLHKRF